MILNDSPLGYRAAAFIDPNVGKNMFSQGTRDPLQVLKYLISLFLLKGCNRSVTALANFFMDYPKPLIPNYCCLTPTSTRVIAF
jgi:hypothetical protein